MNFRVLTALLFGCWLVLSSEAQAQRERAGFQVHWDANATPTAAVISEDAGYIGWGSYVYGFHPQTLDSYGRFPSIGDAARLDDMATVGLALGAGSLFATSRSGTLYRIDASTMEVLERRRLSTACGSDTIRSGPLFYDGANSGLVIVASAHGCGDHTGNQILAFHANGISAAPAWVFNSGEYELDAINACMLRQAVLYCVADAQIGTFSPTVVSIAADTGELRWSFHTDSIVRMPVMSRSLDGALELYVLSASGRLFALDPDTGAPLHSVQFRGSYVASNNIARFNVAASEELADYVFIITPDGDLRAYQASEGASELWSFHPVCAGTSLTIAEGGYRGFLATECGIVQQIHLGAGFVEAQYDFGGNLRANGVAGHMSEIVFYLRSDMRGRIIGGFVDEVTGLSLGVPVQYPAPCVVSDSASYLNCEPILPICSGPPPWVRCRAAPSTPTPAPPQPTPSVAPPVAPPPAAPPPIPMCAQGERGVRVPANGGWCDSGAAVRRGQLVTIRAVGQWSNVGPPSHGPEGFAGYRLAGTVMADADLAALIMDIGGDRYQVGTAFSQRLGASGHVLLSMNDVEGTFADNEGFVEVLIVASR